MTEEKDEALLLYKGHPLVRSGMTLYYGDMTERCVVLLQILSYKEVDGLQMSDKVHVQLMLTDPDIRMKDRILKQGDRSGLFAAMDLGSVWLDRALSSAS